MVVLRAVLMEFPDDCGGSDVVREVADTRSILVKWVLPVERQNANEQLWHETRFHSTEQTNRPRTTKRDMFTYDEENYQTRSIVVEQEGRKQFSSLDRQ